jgi:hypothetical protein
MRVERAGLLKVNCTAVSTVATVLPGSTPGPEMAVPTDNPAVLATFTVFDPINRVAPLNSDALPPVTTTFTRPTEDPPLAACPPETYRCTKYW